MMRVPQAAGNRGSQKWLQIMVNDRPEELNGLIRARLGLPADEAIEWVSPLREDNFAEYRDQGFLDVLGVELASRPLGSFWPARGPQWDALGKTSSGRVLLVEAKAHATELQSPATQASPHSRALIDESLREAREHFGCRSEGDWAGSYYQIANRLAHLHLLRDLNEIACDLLFVYFVGDEEMSGPTSPSEWQPAIEEAHRAIGLLDGLPPGAWELFVDVPR